MNWLIKDVEVAILDLNALVRCIEALQANCWVDATNEYVPVIYLVGFKGFAEHTIASID
jgi:hypothetical protein